MYLFRKYPNFTFLATWYPLFINSVPRPFPRASRPTLSNIAMYTILASSRSWNTYWFPKRNSSIVGPRFEKYTNQWGRLRNFGNFATQSNRGSFFNLSFREMIDPERTPIRFPVTVLLAMMHAGACRYFLTGSVIDQYNIVNFTNMNYPC